MKNKWYRVDHWRYADVRVSEVDVIKEAPKTIWITSSSPRRREQGQGDKYSKKSEDHTFVEGKKAAFDLAIDLTDNKIRNAQTTMRAQSVVLKKLQAQENE